MRPITYFYGLLIVDLFMVLLYNEAMKLKQAVITNCYKLTLTCMEGDADGYKSGSVIGPTYNGSFLEELFNIFQAQIFEVYRQGMGNSEAEDLYLESISKIIQTPLVMDFLKIQEDEEGSEDKIKLFLRTLGYSYYDCGDFVRTPESMELTYFDDKGNEFLVMNVIKQKTNYY